MQAIISKLVLLYVASTARGLPNCAKCTKMILTHCASCATDLPRLARQCSRCKTRYCGPACQEQHWKQGGHDQLCKNIKKEGGAERYHADKKYKEAVAVAVKKCADDTKGQKCYICLEAVHARTGEGLVRGCACGDRDGVSSPELGVAHVLCLAEQAKILCDEAKENNLGDTAKHGRWGRWHTCGLCEQKFHGVVRCALGWACWKTYLSRPEEDKIRSFAMTQLGNGLYAEHDYEDALSVQEADLSMLRRLGSPEESLLITQSNLASTYRALGRLDEALCIREDVYSKRLKLDGEEHEKTLRAASNYAIHLIELTRFEEAKSLLRKKMPVARRVLGESHDITLRMRWNLARSLYWDTSATLNDLREGATMLEGSERTARRMYGVAHPNVADFEKALRSSRAALRAREVSMPGNVSSIYNAVESMTPGDA